MATHLASSGTDRAAGPARTRGTSLAFYAALVLTITFGHYALYRPFVPKPLPRFANVIELDPLGFDAYEETLDRSRPTLMMLGDSHQLNFSTTKRNSLDGIPRRGGDMILDEVARRIDREHAPHERTYARFATPGFKQFEELADLGLLLNRGTFSPKVVVLSTRWEMFITSTMLHLELDTSPMQKYPEAARAWVAELETPAVAAAPAVLAAARAALLSPPIPLTADVADDQAGKWLRKHRMLERDRRLQWGFTFLLQRIEAPLQNVLYGEIEQMGTQHIPLVPDANLRDFNLASFSALIRLLHARGVTVLCYFAPQNPDAPHRELSDWGPDVTRRVREAATDNGCPMLDLSQSVPSGPEYWGFSGGELDPVHMRPAGITEAGRALFEGGERLGVWSALDRP